jgi:hypothetical protein
MLSDVDFSCPAHAYRAVIRVDGQPLCVSLSSIREYLLFKWRKDSCSEVITIHFGVSREFIDSMESQ